MLFLKIILLQNVKKTNAKVMIKYRMQKERVLTNAKKIIAERNRDTGIEKTPSKEKLV